MLKVAIQRAQENGILFFLIDNSKGLLYVLPVSAVESLLQKKPSMILP